MFLPIWLPLLLGLCLEVLSDFSWTPSSWTQFSPLLMSTQLLRSFAVVLSWSLSLSLSSFQICVVEHKRATPSSCDQQRNSQANAYNHSHPEKQQIIIGVQDALGLQDLQSRTCLINSDKHKMGRALRLNAVLPCHFKDADLKVCQSRGETG